LIGHLHRRYHLSVVVVVLVVVLGVAEEEEDRKEREGGLKGSEGFLLNGVEEEKERIVW